MLGKLSTLVFILFLTAACAKPNYQDEPQISGTKDEALKTCQLSFPKLKACVDIEWEKPATESEMGSFLLKFYSLKTSTELLKLDHSVAVVLWMPDMGHGSSPVKIDQISDGHYRASNVFFVMPGEWDIRIQLKEGSDVIDETIQKIQI